MGCGGDCVGEGCGERCGKKYIEMITMVAWGGARNIRNIILFLSLCALHVFNNEIHWLYNETISENCKKTNCSNCCRYH